jgi:hypothetical protein
MVQVFDIAGDHGQNRTADLAFRKRFSVIYERHLEFNRQWPPLSARYPPSLGLYWDISQFVPFLIYLTIPRFKKYHIEEISGGTSMAKRFTDTEKWKKPWFRGLSTNAKLVWIYLCDECDHAGIWPADFDLISFQVGFKVTPQNLELWLGDRVFKVTGDKYFLPSFFEFQYASAKEGFRARNAALDKLRALGLLDEHDRVRDLTDSQGHSPKCASISIGISNTVLINKSEKSKFKIELEEAYKAYPRKQGKTEGIDRLLKEVASGEDVAQFKQAINNYRAHCDKNKTEKQYIMMFSTFSNPLKWRDWVDPQHGESENFADQSKVIDLSGINWTGPEGGAA